MGAGVVAPLALIYQGTLNARADTGEVSNVAEPRSIAAPHCYSCALVKRDAGTGLFPRITQDSGPW